ncbi:MAG: hypothetical protein ACLP9L_29870 [Thermoguttaceae bacterium]
MKVNYLTLFAGATLLLTAAAARAEESAASALATEANTAPAAQPQAASTAPIAAATGNVASYYDDSDPVADFLVRAGAWGVHASGSPSKVGEYQNLDSSAMFDAEGIWSNGERTVDFSASGSDNETDVGRLHYFGPHLEADLDWEQFQHQLDAHDFAGWNFDGNNTAGPAGPYVAPPGHGQNQTNAIIFTQNNLSPGQDFAISVQEFKANFHGNITDNLKWRVNVFGIDKEGDRQVSEFQHCSASAFNGSKFPGGANTANLTNQCHVTTQSQHIDWQTTEVTPSLELRIDCDTVLEYSHTIRDFTANDQAVEFPYATAVASYSINQKYSSTAGSAGYGIVPNSQSQTDRLKFSTKIGCNTDVYLLGYAGYNEDELRDTYRNFQGSDLRITNKSIDSFTVTTYGKYYHEDTTNPLFALSPNIVAPPGTPSAPQFDPYQEPSLAYFGTPTHANPSYIGPEIDRQLSAVGINDRWRPFADECGTLASRLSIVSGWEYSSLKRENADYLLSQQPIQNGPFLSSRGTNAVFNQPDTNKDTFTVGVEEKWSPCFNTFLRYKLIDTSYPLYGVTNQVSYSIDYALNSNMPTRENRVELGCTWTPTDCLMVNATLYVENAYCNAPYLSPWTSNSLPFTLSAWWAPTPDWSLSFGASEMDSWVNQEINLGQINQVAVQNTAVKVPWNYEGVADVFNVASRYRATEKLSFTGEFEYVHGEDLNSGTVVPTQQVPPTGGLPPGAPASYPIGGYSNVQMHSFRFGLGADYILRPRVTSYVRYNYYDYEDQTGTTSGQANMILGGMSATF